MRRLAVAAMLSLAAFAATSAKASPHLLIDPDTRQPMANLAPLEMARPAASAVPREVVSFAAAYAPGTVVVDTAARRLYYVLPGGQAIRYGVGVGRPGFEWGGSQTVTRKQEWPDWRPPTQMLQRRPDLPRFMAGGPENPLGARALYLGSSLYRIHGSNEPHTIGQAVSSGCIRMVNDDVVDLYNRVDVGTRVVVLR
jgi:lipoprotein-anchoring transpeptidase ErfK/SrfK